LRGSQLTCPHRGNAIVMRDLPHQELFSSQRPCPHRGGSFTVDRLTRRRRAVFIVIAVVSLLLTVLLYRDADRWLIPALISYAVLAILLHHGNRKVVPVPWSQNENRDG
jgi:hypothetical protein